MDDGIVERRMHIIGLIVPDRIVGKLLTLLYGDVVMIDRTTKPFFKVVDILFGVWHIPSGGSF